ncbi:NAD/NADP dependent alcohol dehydrogenase [Chamberlinius hualienensis]
MATEGQVITCKAAVLYDFVAPYKVETVKVLPPTPGHVRIKMVATALCHSDLGYSEGYFPNQKLPLIPGHEGGGIVESVGKGVTSVKKGDKVFTMFFQHCGECPFCKSNKTNMCIDIRRKVPILGPFLRAEGLDGLTSFRTSDDKEIYHSFGCSSFSEYTVIPENSCVKVNKDVDLNTGCIMACGFLTGYGSSANAVKIGPTDTVAVWGLGAVGLACVVGCKDKGASRIIGIDVNTEKEAYGRKFGCTDFISLSNLEEGTTIVQKIMQLTTIGLDYAFVCVGLSSVFDDAIKCLTMGGTAVMVGVTKSDATTTFPTLTILVNKKITGAVYGNYYLHDVSKIVDRYVEGNLPIDDFITNTFTLDKINDAVSLMKQGKGIRSVIRF